MRGLGTLVNVAAVVAGTGVGLVAGNRLPERLRTTVLDGIGLLTVCVGVAGFAETRNAVFPVFALVLGTVVGEALDIDGRIDHVGETLRRRARSDDDRFVLVSSPLR